MLLKGRKVARGQLQPVVTLKEDQLRQLDQMTSLKTMSPRPKIVKKAPRTEKQICDAPYGELNQCAWVCEGPMKGLKKCDLNKKGVQCVRRRCDANGQWVDPTPLTDLTTRCELSPVVGACDY